MKSSYDKVKPYITRDGSEIRELMHSAVHGNNAQSLAEASHLYVGQHWNRDTLVSNRLLFRIYVYTITQWAKIPRKKTEILQSAVFR